MKDPERAALEALLAETRSLVVRLEAKLYESTMAHDREHPLVTLRKQRGMSQVDLARAVGLTAPAICRIEHSPGFACRRETQRKIAAIFYVPVRSLFYDAP